ncbi:MULTISPECIES: FAD-dependent oxidoreductase [Streptomyces]|uniref:FAD-dependent oxidoreductase n=1 Tax=Streptomyces TaxID=1883 RepID=UPI00167B008C|nr:MULTISPECIES: FAD-dependent oxidoreductase [Streptomyces]MBD3575377.1 FAD-dependent oxidoreductase [Streptomyces sp. KD18]GGS92743.1 oxygenase [Streptomyces toxytricini]
MRTRTTTPPRPTTALRAATGTPTAPPAGRAARVLVVGAGPVGLTAAHELARRGLPVRLVDAAPGPAATSRAVAVHPRTLETFDQMGLVDSFLASGRRNQAFTMYAAGRRLVRLEADYETMPTRHPYSLVIEQTRTEELLREAVSRLGVTIEWGVRLTALDQDDSAVRATLEHADGTREEYEVPWLVGCDGGHSTVRKQLGLPLIGESRDTWELADAAVETDLPPDTIYWAHTGGQALMMVPYQQAGRWRLLDTAPVRRPGDPYDAADVAARFSRKLSAGLGRPVTVGEPSWSSVFTFQQRMVPRMREGRCFVAGDAAHVHSPASGQGMNTGIQEAYNLGWKLAMADRGQAGPELLATYGMERVPVGRALLGSTRKATFLVQFKNRLAGVALPVVFTFVRNITPLRRAIQRKVLGGMSGLRLAYPDSPLSTPAAGPGLPAGSRAAAAAARHPDAPGAQALTAELRDPRWTLLWAAAGPGEALRVARATAAEHGDWLSVRTVGDTTGRGPSPLPDPDGLLRRTLALGPGGWLLIRPDGYAAAGGTVLGWRALERALAPLGRLAEVHELRPYAEARAEARAEALAEQQRRQVLQQVSGGSPAVRDTVESTPRVLEGQR